MAKCFSINNHKPWKMGDIPRMWNRGYRC